MVTLTADERKLAQLKWDTHLKTEKMALPNYTFDQLFAFRAGVVQRQEEAQVERLEEYKRKLAHEYESADRTFEILEDYFKPEENLISQWTAFGTDTMDCFPEYHTAAMVTLISHLFPAKMTPQYSKRGVHNNMWAIILGNSGCGKSVACGGVVGVAYEDSIAPYFSRISNKFTPESFTQSLQANARRYHYSNECSGFLKLMKRDYAGELPEDLTNAYDGERVSKQTMKMGIIGCDQPLYSGIWNTTVDSWSKNATEDGFASGMFMRPFYIISTRKRELKKDTPMSDTQTKKRDVFVANLLELLELVHGKVINGVIPHPRTIVFAESTYINDWKHGLREDSNSGKYTELEQSALQRVFDQARKLAMNLTIASTEFREYVKTKPPVTAPVTGALQSVNNEIEYEIPEYIAEVACYIAENVFWKNSLRALKSTYTTGCYDKILRAFGESNKKITKTELGGIANLYGKRLTEVLSDLGLEHQRFRVPGSCRPVEYYWVPNK